MNAPETEDVDVIGFEQDHRAVARVAHRVEAEIVEAGARLEQQAVGGPLRGARAAQALAVYRGREYRAIVHPRDQRAVGSRGHDHGSGLRTGRRADREPVGAPGACGGAVQALRIDVERENAVVAPREDRRTRAIGHHAQPGLVAGRGAHGCAVRGPLRHGRAVQVLRVDVPLAAALVLPADHHTAGAVGHHATELLLTGGAAHGEGAGERRTVRVEPARTDLVVAGHLFMPRGPGAAGAIRNRECRTLDARIRNDDLAVGGELRDTRAVQVLGVGLWVDTAVVDPRRQGPARTIRCNRESLLTIEQAGHQRPIRRPLRNAARVELLRVQISAAAAAAVLPEQRQATTGLDVAVLDEPVPGGRAERHPAARPQLRAGAADVLGEENGVEGFVAPDEVRASGAVRQRAHFAGVDAAAAHSLAARRPLLGASGIVVLADDVRPGAPEREQSGGAVGTHGGLVAIVPAGERNAVRGPLGHARGVQVLGVNFGRKAAVIVPRHVAPAAVVGRDHRQVLIIGVVTYQQAGGAPSRGDGTRRIDALREDVAGHSHDPREQRTARAVARHAEVALEAEAR